MPTKLFVAAFLILRHMYISRPFPTIIGLSVARAAPQTVNKCASATVGDNKFAVLFDTAIAKHFVQ